MAGNTNPERGAWYWEIEMDDTTYAALIEQYPALDGLFIKFTNYKWYYCDINALDEEDLVEYGFEFGEVFISYSTQPAYPFPV